MADTASEQMAKRRALLTDAEREILAGERDVKDNYRYSVESRVRTRIRDELPRDVSTLEEYYPELFGELHDVVCDTAPEFVARDDIDVVTYGPSSRLDDGYVLDVGTEDGGRVDIHLPEDAMYSLWTEVQHSPWPDTLPEQDEAAELRGELVDRAMGADADMLRDALDALDDQRA